MQRDPVYGWVGSVSLSSGHAVFIRPTRLGDEPLIQAFVRSLSVESRYQRFFLPIRELSPAALARLTRADHRRTAVVLAFDIETRDGPRVAGMVEYAPGSEGGLCEVAIVVAEGWRRRGLASLLVEEVLAIGVANGFTWAALDILHDNLAARALARRLGAKAAPSPGGGIVRLVLELADRDWMPALSAISPHPAAAAPPQ